MGRFEHWGRRAKLSTPSSPRRITAEEHTAVTQVQATGVGVIPYFLLLVVVLLGGETMVFLLSYYKCEFLAKESIPFYGEASPLFIAGPGLIL